MALDELRDQWGEEYPLAVNVWERNWDRISTMFRFTDDKIAAVQGYQQHVLNAEENWITKAIRINWCAHYMVDLDGRAQVSSLLQLLGSTMIICTDVLRTMKWLPSGRS